MHPGSCAPLCRRWHGHARRDACGIELCDQIGEALCRARNRARRCLARFAVGVEIRAKKRRSLRRAFHDVVGKHLDHAGAEEIRIDIAFLAFDPCLTCRALHRLVAVARVVGIINADAPCARACRACRFYRGCSHTSCSVRPHSSIHQRGNAIGRHLFQHSVRERCPLLDGQRWTFVLDSSTGTVDQQASGRAGGIAGDLAALRIGRRIVMRSKSRPRLLTHTVCPSLPVEHDRPCLLDAVEVTRRRLEAIIVKLYRFEPIIRASRFLGEALLNHWLERFERGGLTSPWRDCTSCR